MAITTAEIRSGAYYDSVVLMHLQRSLAGLPGVLDAGVVMGTEANKEILAQSGKPVVFVMGNDDGILGDGAAWRSEGRIVNIHMRRARCGNTGFVGYQYTNPYVGGTFEKSDEAQQSDFATLGAMIDEGTVLVTHGPALGTLDTAGDGNHVGSDALRRLIEEKRPRMHLFGHIHRAFGIDGSSVNGSYPSSRQFIAIDVDARAAKILRE